MPKNNLMNHIKKSEDLFGLYIKPRKTLKQKSRNTRVGMKEMHYHDFYEVGSSQFEGERIFYTEKEVFIQNSNSFSISSPGKLHGAEKGDISSKILICFSDSYGREVFDFLGLNLDTFFKNNVLIFSDEQKQELWEIGKSLIKELKKSNISVKDNYRAKLLFTNFIAILSKPIEFATPISSNKSVAANVAEFLQINYQNPLTLDFISDKFFVNKYVLCRKFKEEFGISPLKFVIDIRIKHACKLLVEDSLSVNEISEAVGYNSAKHFSAEFKKNVGISPTEYRNHVTKSHL